MDEVGLEIVGALNRGIDEARAVTSQRFQECARVAAVLRARPPIAGIESAVSAIRPEVRAVPEIHQAENAGLDAPRPGCGIALEQVKFLEPFENPEWEVDLDAVGVEDPAVEFVGQSFANRQLVDFGAPARSCQVGEGISSESLGSLAEPFLRPACPSKRILNRKLKVFALYRICQHVWHTFLASDYWKCSLTWNTLNQSLQNYLNWTQEHKALKWLRRGCGLLVLLGGIYTLHRAVM